ncbi:MAG: CYTH domain-containing protein [Thermoanaerobaculales bacterium]|nr:CYTH domain-containing protein [Thermoanaerobaculales bacterium]
MSDTVEVERKFLVDEVPNDDMGAGAEIIQGYLAVGDGEEVRLRAKKGRCFLTVKRGSGLERAEVEVVIDREQFDPLWPATEGRRVEKTRYEVPVGSLTAELDRYHGALDGLLTVEVEFPSVEEAASFDPPEWFGREVTDDARFKNQRLAVDGLPTLSRVKGEE